MNPLPVFNAIKDLVLFVGGGVVLVEVRHGSLNTAALAAGAVFAVTFFYYLAAWSRR